jgi:two-component system nitrogen regulation sensor histidine kinase NtrY
MDNIRNSLSVIKRRSEGLLNFTETYRSLTRIPPPNFQLLDARDMINETQTLFQPKLDEYGIDLQIHYPPANTTFQGDPALLEQVLINLVKNAMDAVRNREDPRIEIHVQKLVNGKMIIQVADNGCGIEKEQLEQIFVPFYTTKTEGSGIGLSLSRQIMRLHKGNIEVQSAIGEGTAVKLTL